MSTTDHQSVTVSATGPMAKDNPFRFSTKRTDNTTDFVLYEYRTYNPTLGRWLSRDPIEEISAATSLDEYGNLVNLYWFAANDPLNKLDNLGLRVFWVFSAGFAFRDPLYGSIGSQVYSGLLPITTFAFYYGWGSPWLTSICNSGPLFLPGFPKESTSFVKAWMITLCPGRYRVTCRAELNAYVWGAKNKRVFYTLGQILGEPIQKHETVTVPVDTDSYFSMFSKSITKDIMVRRNYTLYYLYMPTCICRLHSK